MLASYNQINMQNIWIVGIALLAYLAYKFFIKPMRIKAYYSKTFRAHGYKVFEYPYSLLQAPYMGDWIQNQKTKNDYRYTGVNVYSDSYDVVIANVYNKPQVIFLSEKLMKGFLDKDLQTKFAKMNTGYEILSFIINKGLPFLEKNSWKHSRTTLSKVFNFDFIISQIPIMIQATDLVFPRLEEEYWVSHPEKKAARQISLSLYDMIANYTSTIIMAGFLGLESMKEQLKGKTIQQQILKLCDQSIKLSRDPLNMMFGQKFLKLGLRKNDRELLAFNKEINEILRSYIQSYRLKQSKKEWKKQKLTIIQLILQTIEKEKNVQDKESQFTDDNLIDQIKTFVIAGTDTTSNYLTMLLLYIYEHKEVLQRLKLQIDKHIKSDADITYENIKKITYFDCVLTESSRLFGAAENGFERILQEDSSICDIPLFKGTCLNLYLRPFLSNPKNFPDPLAFKPQRWLAQTQQNKRLAHIVSYQFYGGPRGCIGKQLALTETKVAVIKFLRRYKSLVEPGMKSRGCSLELTSHIINSDVTLERSQ